MIKGAPVKTEARAIPGASATTEVQNNILLAAPDPADASVVLLCRSSCMILLPLELWTRVHHGKQEKATTAQTGLWYII